MSVREVPSRLRTARAYWRFARIAFAAGRALTVMTAGSTLAAAVFPLVGVAAIGAVVGRIPDVLVDGFHSASGRSALLWGLVAASLFLVQWAAAAVQSAAATALVERVDFVLQRDLMSAVMAPVGISHLEDARTLDLINVGRETFRAGWVRPGRLAINLSALLAARIILLGACVILAAFRWPLAIGFLIAGLWAEHEGRIASKREAEHHYGETELARRTEYYYELGVTPEAAKEVRVFGLSDFLLGRFIDTWTQSMGLVFRRESPRPLVSTSALAATGLFALAWVGVEAVRGGLGIGETTVYAQAIMMGLAGVGAATRALLQSEMSVAALERYDSAIRSVADASAVPTTPGRAVGEVPRREIRFEGVTFGYPGTDSEVLRGLDLRIPAGESLAIVGANGAGKTTLVKLVCRLYEPTAGRILVDGVDLSELDSAGWRKRIAAVFQDYVRYALSARTNVGFGYVEMQHDLSGIEAAAVQAGVAGVVAGTRGGWDTVLSTDYANGVDLSGGEAQKVALARALFAIGHGASVLILDEPAANLDARAEAHLYEQFLSMTEGITTIVISHRFSTVRQASSIAVIRDGRVAEQGSHDELLTHGGQYCEMFRLQASRFEATADEEAVPR